MNLMEVDSASVVMADGAVFATTNEEHVPHVSLYLDHGPAVQLAHRVSVREGIEASAVFLGGIDSVRNFVKTLPGGCVVMVRAGEHEETDRVQLSAVDLLAELPAGNYYAHQQAATYSDRRFDSGEVNITPGVRRALGSRVGGIVQTLLDRHLSGDYGAVPKAPEEPGLKSDWQLNDEGIEAGPEPYVMSVYEDVEGATIWIVTQYGQTYVMLPSEY